MNAVLDVIAVTIICILLICLVPVFIICLPGVLVFWAFKRMGRRQ